MDSATIHDLQARNGNCKHLLAYNRPDAEDQGGENKEPPEGHRRPHGPPGEGGERRETEQGQT